MPSFFVKVMLVDLKHEHDHDYVHDHALVQDIEEQLNVNLVKFGVICHGGIQRTKVISILNPIRGLICLGFHRFIFSVKLLMNLFILQSLSVTVNTFLYCLLFLSMFPC